MTFLCVGSVDIDCLCIVHYIWCPNHYRHKENQRQEHLCMTDIKHSFIYLLFENIV